MRERCGDERCGEGEKRERMGWEWAGNGPSVCVRASPRGRKGQASYLRNVPTSNTAKSRTIYQQFL